nr:hypothetical protein [Tanacetum cinerariifolium]
MKTVLATKDEAGVHLNEDENYFMLDNAYVDNTLEEINAAVIMMACIQPTNDKSDAKPTYDAELISEVNALQVDVINGLLSKSDHEQRHHEKLEIIIHTYIVDQIESNIIFDDLENLDYREAYEEFKNEMNVEKEQLLNEKEEIHEELLKTQDETLKIKRETDLYKKAFKERENKHLEDMVSLEEKLRSHDRIVHKTSHSLQKFHMLGKKPNKVYDPHLKTGLGYKNLERLKKAIKAQPKMYEVLVFGLHIKPRDMSHVISKVRGETMKVAAGFKLDVTVSIKTKNIVRSDANATMAIASGLGGADSNMVLGRVDDTPTAPDGVSSGEPVLNTDEAIPNHVGLKQASFADMFSSKQAKVPRDQPIEATDGENSKQATPVSFADIINLERSSRKLNFRTLVNNERMESYDFVLLKLAVDIVKNSKWSPSSTLKKDVVTKVPVWVKLHKVPLLGYSEDGLSLISTQIGTPIMLDAFTSSMCVESWGRLRFARTLIELSSDMNLKKEPPRCAECKIFGDSFDKCPKIFRDPVISTTTDTTSDRFTKVTRKKNKGDECAVPSPMGMASEHTSSKFNEEFESDDEVDEVIFPERNKWDDQFDIRLKGRVRKLNSKMAQFNGENVSLHIQIESVVQEREKIKLEYQKVFKSIKMTRVQHQQEVNELIQNVNQKTYAYGEVRAKNQDLLMTIFEL